jgi:hypothetical protein
MENRRKDYRHHFSHPHRIGAELASFGPKPVHLTGEILDLSLGGAAVQIDEQTHTPASSSQWKVRFSLPAGEVMSLNATFIRRATPETPSCGFQFLPLVDPLAQENRERMIGRFLMDEQRKLRAERLGDLGAKR